MEKLPGCVRPRARPRGHAQKAASGRRSLWHRADAACCRPASPQPVQQSSTHRLSQMLPSAMQGVLSNPALHQGNPEIFLCLDYDGTLTPIVPQPSDAVPLPGNGALLQQASALFNVAILSGRSVGTLRSLLAREVPPPPPGALDHVALCGSHGTECYVPAWAPDGSVTIIKHLPVAHVRPTLQAARSIIEGVLAGFPKAALEDCVFSLSVHYRHLEEHEVKPLRHAIDQVLKSYPELRIRDGKKVWEVRPAAPGPLAAGSASGLAWDKGSATRWILEEMYPAHGAWRALRPAASSPASLGPPLAPAGAGTASGSPVTAPGTAAAKPSRLQVAIALGDDTTDEDTFRAVLEWAAADPVSAGGTRLAVPIIVGDPASSRLVQLALPAAPSSAWAATGLSTQQDTSTEEAGGSSYVPTAPDSTRSHSAAEPHAGFPAGTGEVPVRPTYATHYLRDPQEVAAFIAQLVAVALPSAGGAAAAPGAAAAFPHAIKGGGQGVGSGSGSTRSHAL